MGELLQFILDHEAPFKSQSRLASLYSDFSHLKTTNPDGYRANVDAWTAALVHAGPAGVVPGSGSFTIRTGDALAGELQSKRLGRPLALQEIFSDAVANKAMIPLQDFLTTERSIYEKSWIQFHIPSPWQIASWGLRRIGIGLGANQLTDGEFVVMANVEAAAKALVSRLKSQNAPATPTSLIYSLDTFRASFSDLLSAPNTHGSLSLIDLKILLRHITRDKHIAAVSSDSNGNTTTIRFLPPNSTTPPEPISQHDTTIATLHTLAMNLDVQIHALQSRVDTLNTAVRDALQHNQRTTALTRLRTKKALEVTLDKRTASYDQVQSVLLSIDEAAGQVEMVRAFEAGGNVLAELNKRIGGIDRVDEVMEGLRGEMEKVEGVTKVLGEVGAETVDEIEVDEEMEALEREIKDKKMEEERDKVGELPTVPIGLVTSRIKGNKASIAEQEVGMVERSSSVQTLDVNAEKSQHLPDHGEALMEGATS